MPDVGWRRTAFASLVVCGAGGALLAHATDGFRALTTEQARRLSVERAPVELPEAQLEDQHGRVFSLAAYRGQPVVVNFVYTQCRSVCPLLTAGFQRLDRAPSESGHVPLVSISFDPRDTPERLREYSVHFGASDAWRFARARDTTDLPALLAAFGIIVIPDGRGDFQHNAAVHVLDDRGRLARVLDRDASVERVLREVQRLGAPDVRSVQR